MTAQDLAALYVSSPSALPMDDVAVHAQTQQIVLPAPTPQLDEPSSLTLAFVGVVTLTAYRSIFKRVTPAPVVAKATIKAAAPSKKAPKQSHKQSAKRKGSKQRRRAA